MASSSEKLMGGGGCINPPLTGRGLNKATVTLGYFEAPIVNHVIVVGKRMIANKSFLSMDILFNMLRRDMQTERFIANKRGKISDHDNKWRKIAVALD